MTPDQDKMGGRLSAAGAGAFSASAVADDRRVFERVSRPVKVRLIGCGCEDIRDAQIRDIGAGGLFVQLPADRRICVGQRYDVQVDPAGHRGAGVETGGEESWGATVIRTEHGAGTIPGMIGAAMRFDQPVYF